MKNRNYEVDNTRRLYMAFVAILAVTVVILAILLIQQKQGREIVPETMSEDAIERYKPEIDVELLTPNPYSRPQTATDDITGIVIHYVANPGSSAIANRNYFENLKDVQSTYASSNFIVGLEGEIVQCIPTDEVAYASNNRNNDTVSIEVCHPDETGKFNDTTYESLVWLTGWLCGYLDVEPENIIRHYDVTGKPCPLYYVEHEEEWLEFKEDVRDWIDEHRE